MALLLRQLFETLEVLDPSASFPMGLVCGSTHADLEWGRKKQELGTVSAHMFWGAIWSQMYGFSYASSTCTLWANITQINSSFSRPIATCRFIA